MLADKDRIFTNVYGFQPWGLKAAQARGDWDNTKKLLEIGQDAIIDRIKASGLRGRGGAGFPTGTKWGFMPKEPRADRPNFLVINADESEPGSCKDREIIRHDPHKLIEGALVAGYAMRARAAYIYIRGEYIREAETLFAAIAEAYDAGLIGKNACGSGYDFDVFVPSRGWRVHLRRRDRDARKPRGQEGPAAAEAAFPGGRGALWLPDDGQQRRDRSRSCRPSCVAAPEWFASFGAENNRGTKLFQISGHVNKPCVVEEAMCIPFRQLIEKHCGGIRGGWDNLLAVIPGGSSVPLVPAARDHGLPDGLRRAEGGRLGPRHRGGDRHGQVDRHRPRDQPHQLLLQARKLRPVHAVPRRHRLDVARDGAAAHRRRRRVARSTRCYNVTKQVEGHTICALGDAAAWPIQGLIRHFRPEMERRITERQGRRFLTDAGGGRMKSRRFSR